MKLYRYLSEQELFHILANENDDIGGFFYGINRPRRINSHEYKKNVKYLHFYFDKKEIERIVKLKYHSDSVCYICEFEIPFYVIFPYIGYGRYDSCGYNNPYDTVYEVAFPSKKMKRKYLISYEKDKNTEDFEYELNI